MTAILHQQVEKHDRQLQEHAKDIAELKRARKESDAAMKRLETRIEATRKTLTQLKG